MRHIRTQRSNALFWHGLRAALHSVILSLNSLFEVEEISWGLSLLNTYIDVSGDKSWSWVVTVSQVWRYTLLLRYTVDMPLESHLLILHKTYGTFSTILSLMSIERVTFFSSKSEFWWHRKSVKVTLNSSCSLIGKSWGNWLGYNV